MSGLAAYAAPLPTGSNGEAMQEFPSPQTAKARYGATTQASSVITLTDDTTVIDLAVAGGQGVVLRWVSSTDTQASVIASGAGINFDHAIPANTRMRFVVPIEKMGVGSASVVGTNVKYGLYKRLAYKAAAAPASSVFVAEH